MDGFDFAGIRLPSGVPCKDLADYATLLDDEQPDPERVFMGFPMLPVTAHKKTGEARPEGIYSPGSIAAL